MQCRKNPLTNLALKRPEKATASPVFPLCLPIRSKLKATSTVKQPGNPEHSSESLRCEIDHMFVNDSKKMADKGLTTEIFKPQFITHSVPHISPGLNVCGKEINIYNFIQY